MDLDEDGNAEHIKNMPAVPKSAKRVERSSRGLGMCPSRTSGSLLPLTPPISINEKRVCQDPFFVEMGGVEPPSE